MSGLEIKIHGYIEEFQFHKLNTYLIFFKQ